MADEDKKVLEPVQDEQKPVPASKGAVKKKKPFFLLRWGRGIGKWFRDLKSEAKKVVWPTGKSVVNNTIIVIIAIIVVCIFVYILDVTFGFVRDLIVNLV